MHTNSVEGSRSLKFSAVVGAKLVGVEVVLVVVAVAAGNCKGLRRKVQI